MRTRILLFIVGFFCYLLLAALADEQEAPAPMPVGRVVMISPESNF